MHMCASKEQDVISKFDNIEVLMISSAKYWKIIKFKFKEKIGFSILIYDTISLHIRKKMWYVCFMHLTKPL